MAAEPAGTEAADPSASEATETRAMAAVEPAMAEPSQMKDGREPMVRERQDMRGPRRTSASFSPAAVRGGSGGRLKVAAEFYPSLFKYKTIVLLRVTLSPVCPIL